MRVLRSDDGLPALSTLERCFDGPIPEPVRRSALLGNAVLPALLLAEAQVRFFASMIRGQFAIIRHRRGTGSFYQELASDLVLYRKQGRLWRRELRRLQMESQNISVNSA